MSKYSDEKCPVCGYWCLEGEATCGSNPCRMEYWGIMPDEIYEDMWCGADDE